MKSNLILYNIYMSNNKKVKINSLNSTKKKGGKIRKKGGVNSTKRASSSNKIEMKTIKTKNSPIPDVKISSFLDKNLDYDYLPSSKCIKLKKELDDYNENIKRNSLLQAEYNEQMAIYHRDLLRWYNSDEYKELEAGMYYSSLGEEERSRLEKLEPSMPNQPKLKILKKPSKKFIELVKKECGKHFIQNN